MLLVPKQVNNTHESHVVLRSRTHGFVSQLKNLVLTPCSFLWSSLFLRPYHSGRGFYHYRNGTLRYEEDGITPFTCDDRDDALCCKVGNGNEPQKYTCFEPVENDDTTPEGISNDD